MAMASGVFSRLISAITPRSDNYFALFNNLAESAVTGSKVLAMMTTVNEANKFKAHLLKFAAYNRKQTNTPKKF